MVLQAITVADQYWAHSKRNVDFIKRYIFPGGQLVSLGAIGKAVADETDLRITHLEEISPHYAETLARWRERMFENLGAMRALGLPQQFLRMWEYYLCLQCVRALRIEIERGLLLGEPRIDVAGVGERIAEPHTEERNVRLQVDGPPIRGDRFAKRLLGFVGAREAVMCDVVLGRARRLLSVSRDQVVETTRLFVGFDDVVKKV